MAARYVIGNLCISDGYRKLAGRFTAAVTGLGSSPGLSLGVTQADSESAIFQGGAALVRPCSSANANPSDWTDFR